MRFARAGTVVTLAVLVAACDTVRTPETVTQDQIANCTRCHGYPPPAFITAGADTRTHPTSTNCNGCHPGTVETDNLTIVQGGLHMDGIVEATGGHPAGYSDPARHGPDALAFLGGGAGDCASCHGSDFAGGSSGKSCNDCHSSYADDWRTNCTFCHGTATQVWTDADLALAAPPAPVDASAPDATARVGAHAAHLTAGTFSGALACASCHVVPGGGAALQHFAGGGAHGDVAFSAVARQGVPGAAYAGGACAVYCHGVGSEFPGSTLPTSPAWTDAGISCGDCHGTPPASGRAIGGQSAHAFHVSAGATCGSCHPGYTLSDVNLAIHVDGSKQVAVAGTTITTGWDDCNGCHTAGAVAIHAIPFGTAHASAALKDVASCKACHGADYGGGVGPSCNGCHGTSITSSAPDWKTNCTFCHGTRTANVATAIPAAAPPEPIDGAAADQTRTNPKVGAHQAHLAAGPFSAALPCASCHAVPDGAGALAHFDGYEGGQADVAFSALAAKGVASASYAASGGACAVYCHGSGSEFANPAGQASPAWTSTGLTCGSCHGFPPSSGPTSLAPNAHEFHLAKGATCGTCHGAGYSGAAVDLAKHVNGTKDVVANGTPVAGWDCATCHTALGVGHASPYTNHAADALANIASCTSCHAGYGGVTGPSDSCNACHAAAVSASAPDWKTNCSFCHGTRTQGVTTAAAQAAPPQPVDGSAADQTHANPRIGAHQAHLVPGTFSNALPCASCHAVPTAAESLTHFAAYDGSPADVALSGLAGLGLSAPSYDGDGGSCAVYCHGSGDRFANAPTQVSPAWTATGLACGDCHDLPPASGPTYLAPNAHAYHLAQGATCASCHPGYAPGGVNLALHVNGAKDVAGNGTAVSGWDCVTCHDAIGVPPSTHPVPYPTHTTDALANIASCQGCHGADYGGGLNGLAPSCTGCHATQVTASAPDWKTNCTFCHGTRTAGVTTGSRLSAPPQAVVGTGDQTRANPKVGAHQAHLTAGTYAGAFLCSTCHMVPTDALGHFAGYGGGSAPLTFDALATKLVPTPTYTGSGGGCTVYCHGSGTMGTDTSTATFAWPTGSVAANKTPAWTSTGLACNACHASRPATGWHLYSAHDGVPCAECHRGYVQDTSVNPAYHVNGSRSVVFQTRGGGTRVLETPGWGNCANCHDSGAAGNVFAPPF